MERQAHQERTFVILKTDAVQRGLMGEVIKRFEQSGLKIAAAKMVMPTEELLMKHYNKDDVWYTTKGERIIEDLKSQGKEAEKPAIEYGKDIIRTIVRYMTESPVMALVVEGVNSVNTVTKLVGSTEPANADVGTIRGDYCIDTYTHSAIEDRAVKNLIHCSDSPEEAAGEIALWLNEDEVYDYATAQERIMYEAIKNS